jgi:sphingolipid C9-methyltransferase
VKNINSTHRVEGIPSQYGLSGAFKAADEKVDLKAWAEKNADLFPTSAAQ